VKSLVEKNGYKIGSEGVIIDLYPEHNAVLLEMYDEKGQRTLDWEDYKFSEIKLIWSIATGKDVID
jgi:hypothetical protein